MTATRKCCEWVQRHGAWIAIVMLACGAFGYGYCLATVQARADRTVEIANTSQAYREALASKDRLIGALTTSTVKATTQAVDAAATAVQATDAANAANAKPPAKPKAATKPTGSTKAKEWTR